jgi:hypothetical protein
MADPAPEPSATPQAAPDPEVTAIGKVNEALAPLEPEVRQRVLRWAVDRFGVALSKTKTAAGKAGDADEEDEDNNDGSQQQEFADFASLYDTANPKTEPEKALVAGYWLQQANGGQDWDSQSANKDLKNLGHGVTNITVSLGALIERKPRLVMQTRKEGTSRQARKKYKLTTEGVRKVKQMIANPSAAESGNGGQG